MRIKIATIGAVARAIYRTAEGDVIQFERLAPIVQDYYLRMAKTAIEEYVKCQK